MLVHDSAFVDQSGALLGRLVVLGTVADIEVRKGEKNGNAWSIRTAFIPLMREVIRVQIPDDIHVELGQKVAWVVSPSVFNGRMEFRFLTELLDYDPDKKD